MTAGSIAPAPALAGAPPVSTRPEALDRLWLRLLREGWSSLAIVAVGPGASGRPVAEAFASLGRTLELPLQRFDATRAGAADGVRVAADAASAASAGARVAIEVDLDGGAANAVLAVADAVLFVVAYGATGVAQLADAVDSVGRDRVLGCVAVRR